MNVKVWTVRQTDIKDLIGKPEGKTIWNPIS